jgi:hypothetical protein
VGRIGGHRKPVNKFGKKKEKESPVNKKDLAVHLGSMTTRTREEMEGVMGDEPNKRYHFTKYW